MRVVKLDNGNFAIVDLTANEISAYAALLMWGGNWGAQDKLVSSQVPGMRISIADYNFGKLYNVFKQGERQFKLANVESGAIMPGSREELEMKKKVTPPTLPAEPAVKKLPEVRLPTELEEVTSDLDALNEEARDTIGG